MKKPVIKILYDSPVVLTFALLSLAALIINNQTDGWANVALFSVYRSSFADPLTYVRMFCHVLGHSDFTHFISNIPLLLVLGPIAEKHYGSVNTLISILITALVSGLVHFAFFPRIMLLGASGIVFMMIFLSSASGLRNGTIPLSLIFVAILFLGKEIYTLVYIDDNISQITHIIGGVCGILYGAVLSSKKGNRK